MDQRAGDRVEGSQMPSVQSEYIDLAAIRGWHHDLARRTGAGRLEDNARGTWRISLSPGRVFQQS